MMVIRPGEKVRRSSISGLKSEMTLKFTMDLEQRFVGNAGS